MIPLPFFVCSVSVCYCTSLQLLMLQILMAIDLALDCKDTQADLWNRICRDDYMAYAVQECYYSIEKILHAIVDGEGRRWYIFPSCYPTVTLD